MSPPSNGLSRVEGDVVRCAIATAAQVPQGDEDAPALLTALQQRGIVARPIVWDDPSVDWAMFDVVVVRSTWDYVTKVPEFLAWIDRVSVHTRLVNPAAALRWNVDKQYLLELEHAGFPVVPTHWLAPGDPLPHLRAGAYVAKPAISAGSRDTARFELPEQLEALAAHVVAISASGRRVLLQPHLAHVASHGERDLVYLGGAYSHTVTRVVSLHPGEHLVTDLYRPEATRAARPDARERTLAEDVMTWLRTRFAGLAYARIDLVQLEHASPAILEVELTEPSLFLAHDTGAADRLAAALAEQLPCMARETSIHEL